MEDEIDTPQPRFLVIVSRDKPDLYRCLVRDFAHVRAVEVILDRRRGERRRWDQPNPEDRRRFNRRSDFSDESQLYRDGFKISRRQEGEPTTDRMN